MVTASLKDRTSRRAAALEQFTLLCVRTRGAASACAEREVEMMLGKLARYIVRRSFQPRLVGEG